MKKKTLGTSQCPIARSLDMVGEWWSILILRDALYGLTRFDEFEKSLKIAPNILTKRLATLVEAGLLERRQYNERPPRYEYVITQKGIDFRPIILTLLAWGNKYAAPEGISLMLVNPETGAPVDPVIVDRNTGLELTPATAMAVPGPAANEAIRERYSNPTYLQKLKGESL